MHSLAQKLALDENLRNGFGDKRSSVEAGGPDTLVVITSGTSSCLVVGERDHKFLQVLIVLDGVDCSVKLDKFFKERGFRASMYARRG
jgi:hypothetical protein